MDTVFASLGSSNTVEVHIKSLGDYWEADPESRLFKMAERAVEREWGRAPLFVREGGTMPVRAAGLPLEALLAAPLDDVEPAVEAVGRMLSAAVRLAGGVCSGEDAGRARPAGAPGAGL